jgi:hypothetical protein
MVRGSEQALIAGIGRQDPASLRSASSCSLRTHIPVDLPFWG